jgi:acyl-CoA synthetase (AMP-forming)/AMP-acid ligase II
MTTDHISRYHPARRATIGDLMRRNAKRFPDREALVMPVSKANPVRRSLTYAELNASVNRMAHALEGLGIVRGNVIATMGRNLPETVVTFWAAMKIGAVVTGVNYTFTSGEIVYQLTHSRAKALLVEDRFVEKIDLITDPLPDLQVRIVNDTYADTSGDQWLKFSQLMADGDDTEPVADVSEDDLAILPYTSGTEALPKAVMVPHRNYLVSMIPSYVTGMGLVEDDVWYYVLPFHTIAGMGMQIALLSLANTIVLPVESTPAEALDAIVDEKVTVVGQTPTFYLQVINASDFYDMDLSRLRRGITYGGTMPQSMFDAFAKVAPDLLWITLWSQSELTQTPTIGRFQSLADIPNGDVAWIGKPTSQLEVRVVDPDDNDVEPGVEGELICRSPGVMLGYLNNADLTATVMRNGWLHTGDLVRRDAEGNLFFVDRQKDVIKSGGMNVSSVEVERVCYQFPGVQEIAVVGLADDYWSQAVTAFVVPRDGTSLDASELIAYCKERLAGYKVPKSVRIVASLPKDTQGKMLKRELRRAAEGEAKARVDAAPPAT